MIRQNVIISCEHAVNAIPENYQCLFNDQEDILSTHHAVDIGALYIANQFKRALSSPLVTATVSRLIIDCNRSITHPACFSAFTQGLPHQEKQQLIQNYYQPFRQRVESLIQTKIKKGIQVIHLSIHSFTPVLNNIPRNADIGLLYDPKRNEEKKLATQWRKRIIKENEQLRIRMNYPYRGIADGFTSALRKQYSERNYLGFEIECNQALTKNEDKLKRLTQTLIGSFRAAQFVLRTNCAEL